MSKHVVSMAVREFVETMYIGGDLLPVSSSVLSAQIGMRLHQTIQGERSEDYRAEVPVSYEQEGELITLRLFGRMDGLQPGDPPMLEEIKSFSGDLITKGFEGLPVHWAQTKVYAALHCRDNELPGMVVRLIYVHAHTQQIHTFDRYHTSDELMDWLVELCARYIEQAEREERRVLAAGESNRNRRFPFENLRAGQQQMIDAVYQHVRERAMLFVSAPTGIGKTMAALYPAIRAMAQGACRKLFYLTARNPVKAVAEESFRALLGSGFALRGITMTAKEVICLQATGTPCHPEFCPMAKGFYDRLPQALDSLPPYGHLGRRDVLQLARMHNLCPHELSLSIAEVCDLVICDYNYVFDPRVRLRRFFDRRNPYHLLIDEAHNLVDRARDMYSASLEESVLRAWLDDLPLAPASRDEAELQTIGEEVLHLLQTMAQELADGGEAMLEAVPDELIATLSQWIDYAEPMLALQPTGTAGDRFLDLYFMVKLFLSVEAELDEDYRILLSRERQSAALRLRCIDPAQRLRQSYKMVNGAVFFSATLTPFSYYSRLLGPEEPSLLQLPSPYPQENLKVLHMAHDTTYAKRVGSMERLVEALGAFVTGRKGNYLIFFPSYQYMNAAHSLFVAGNPELYAPIQQPGMGDGDRAAFLAAFDREHPAGMAAFAVMGGIFGEGIDLTGERVIGIAIVGVGLPQICLERNLMRKYHDELEEPGYEYAYTIPGFNRVMQAVGRLIRTEEDQGVALLIDRRFGWSRYRELMPPWWQPVERVANASAISRAVRSFWQHGLAFDNENKES